MKNRTSVQFPEDALIVARLPELNLGEIAAVIDADWGKRVSIHARPYLDAMREMDNIGDDYFCDSGKTIVIYFLMNATAWHGPVARAPRASSGNGLISVSFRRFA
jgi:hypothetical protein